MTYAKIKILVVLVLFIPYLQTSNFDEYVKKYLKEIEKMEESVFVTSCQSSSDSNYTAILILKAASKEGLLIERKSKKVINLGEIKITSKGLKVQETHGGVYTYDRVSQLLDELMKHKFKLFSPIKTNKLENLISNKENIKCKNIPLSS